MKAFTCDHSQTALAEVPIYDPISEDKKTAWMHICLKCGRATRVATEAEVEAMKQGAVNVHTDGAWLAIPALQENGRPVLPAPAFGPPQRTGQTTEMVNYEMVVRPFVLGPNAPTSDGAWLTGEMALRAAAGRVKPGQKPEDPLSAMARLAAAILLARRKALKKSQGIEGPEQGEEPEA